MRISGEGKIGIALGLLGLAGAGAIMVFPTHTEIGWAMIGGAAIGFILLLAHHVRVKDPKPPRLRCTFDANDIGGCVCLNTTLTTIIEARPPHLQSSAPEYGFLADAGTIGTVTPRGGFYGSALLSKQRGVYYRIKVSAENGTVSGAKGRLISIKRGPQKLIAETLDLPFAPAEPKNHDRLNKTIHVDSPEHLDFLFVSDDHQVRLTPPDFNFPSAVSPGDLFKSPGDYFLTIKVLSPAATDEIVIVLKWTGDRSTSALVAMKN